MINSFFQYDENPYISILKNLLLLQQDSMIKHLEKSVYEITHTLMKWKANVKRLNHIFISWKSSAIESEKVFLDLNAWNSFQHAMEAWNDLISV
jgi:hypothetical protein